MMLILIYPTLILIQYVAHKANMTKKLSLEEESAKNEIDT